MCAGGGGEERGILTHLQRCLCVENRDGHLHLLALLIHPGDVTEQLHEHLGGGAVLPRLVGLHLLHPLDGAQLVGRAGGGPRLSGEGLLVETRRYVTLCHRSYVTVYNLLS